MLSASAVRCLACPNPACFVKNCDEAWLGYLSKNKYQVVYKAGQYVFRKNDPVEGLFFVYKGRIKVSGTSTDGGEQIVRLASDGHVLGHRGFGGGCYPINAIAIQDSRVCFIENELLYKAFMANPAFTFQLMRYYFLELRKSEQGLIFLSQMSMVEKIVAALL